MERTYLILHKNVTSLFDSKEKSDEVQYLIKAKKSPDTRINKFINGGVSCIIFT